MKVKTFLLVFAILLCSCTSQASEDNRGVELKNPTKKEKAIYNSGYAFGYAKGQTSSYCKLIQEKIITRTQAEKYIKSFLESLSSSKSKLNSPFILKRIKEGVNSTAKNINCPIKINSITLKSTEGLL